MRPTAMKYAAVHLPGGPLIEGSADPETNVGNEVWRTATMQLLDGGRIPTADISSPGRLKSWLARRPANSRGAVLIGTANLLHWDDKNIRWTKELLDVVNSVQETTVLVGLGIQQELRKGIIARDVVPDILLYHDRQTADRPASDSRYFSRLRELSLRQRPLLNRSAPVIPSDLYLTTMARALLTRVARSHDRKHFYRGTVGVRGAFTAAALRGHHLEAAEIGCPSLFLNTRAHLGRRLEAKYRTLARRLEARHASWLLGNHERVGDGSSPTGSGSITTQEAAEEPPLRLAVVFGRGQRLWNQLLLSVASTLGLAGNASLIPVVQDKNDLTLWTSRLCNSSQPLAPPEVPWRGVRPVCYTALVETRLHF